MWVYILYVPNNRVRRVKSNCTDVTNFILIGRSLMALFRFSKMAVILSLIYFRFLVVWRPVFRKAKNYLHTKFRPDISIHGRDITTSGFWKTNGRHIEILLPVLILTFSLSSACDSALAYQILSKSDGVMTSYWFYKMAAIASQIYFRFLVWPNPTYQKAQSYQHTKFRQDISIDGRDITTSGFWKQTAAVLKIDFRFRFWPFHCHRHVVFHRYTKFHQNRIIRGRVMTS